MSTRSVIAFSKGDGRWEGRYHHSDGYPKGLGSFLFKAFNGYFQRDLAAMRKYLFEDHPAGFESILKADFSMPCGYPYSDRLEFCYEKGPDGKFDFTKPKAHGAVCFCHGALQESADLRCSEDVGTSDLEWLYVLENVGYTTVMHVSMPKDTGKKDEEGYALCKWEQVSTIDLAEPEPDWETIECGENLERCKCYAHHHFPELNGTTMERLGTKTFLGIEPLDLHDAIAYQVNGLRYYTTGSGCGGTDKRGDAVWVATVTPQKGVDYTCVPYRLKDFRKHDGRRFVAYENGQLEMIVQRKNSKGQMVPYRGVKPIYPPTLKDPIRLFAELRTKTVSAAPPESSAQGEKATAPHAGLLANLENGRLFRTDEKVTM